MLLLWGGGNPPYVEDGVPPHAAAIRLRPRGGDPKLQHLQQRSTLGTHSVCIEFPQHNCESRVWDFAASTAMNCGYLYGRHRISYAQYCSNCNAIAAAAATLIGLHFLWQSQLLQFLCRYRSRCACQPLSCHRPCIVASLSS